MGSTTCLRKSISIINLHNTARPIILHATRYSSSSSSLRGQRNNVRSETDIANVVEQRIWHSMEEGHFENLPGKGKPLKLDTNPHADPAEDTLYRILSKNGCAPEWTELNKEIRYTISEWRASLKNSWADKCRGDHSKWIESSEDLKLQLKEINNKVFRYNLIVPFGRQMCGLKWEKELGYVEEEELDSMLLSNF
ncbi:hypothetical protein Lal_00038147 [Lupinus albus]|uniref:Putative DnaJ subfamily C, member 28 domain-containing protein n=1 Tax=Lupinus albus TaxID=3870 RepID=A0A6A4R2N7_LUPAL|nr:putative DnaJ subfamily C, member 28 domain-containing protein [Lupinus albus]KAF1877838.1 hypothetical protein Lal_00038147 [Lupinus albus]